MSRQDRSKGSGKNNDSRQLASTRHKARHYAVQALYQWQLNRSSVSEIEAQFRVEYNMKGVDIAYFHELLAEGSKASGELDEIMIPLLNDRKLDELDPVTLSLLRMSLYELRERIDVPYRVVINEAINLAKKFGPEDSQKFVNGVLDKAVQDLRAIEVEADAKVKP